MRNLIALAAALILPSFADAQGCQGQSGGCSGVQVRVVVASGGCQGGQAFVSAGCFGMVPVVSGCSGGLGGARVVAVVRPAQVPAREAKDKKASDAPQAPSGPSYAILEQPRRIFLRLPPRRVAVLVD